MRTLRVLFVILLITAVFAVFLILNSDVAYMHPEIFEPKGRFNIFFVETRSPETGIISNLLPRQACAIESASTLNPDWTIFVYILNANELGENPYWTIILSLPNVHIKFIHAAEFAHQTPTEHLLRKGLKTRPEWLTSHTSDVMRYTILYKYAGVYMDLDVISMKSLNTVVPNFAGQQESQPEIYTGSAIVGFGNDAIGRKLAKAVAEDVASNFTGNVWGGNGLDTLSRQVSRMCHTQFVENATLTNCSGFRLYPISTFYAIPYYQHKWFFQAQHYDQAMQAINSSVVAHLWNYMSVNETSTKNESATLICKLAKDNCPLTYGVDNKYCL